MGPAALSVTASRRCSSASSSSNRCRSCRASTTSARIPPRFGSVSQRSPKSARPERLSATITVVTGELENGRLLDKVLEQLPAAVVIAEAPSGRVLLANRQVSEILGFPWTPASEIGAYSDEVVAWHADGRRVEPDEYPELVATKFLSEFNRARDEQVVAVFDAVWPATKRRLAVRAWPSVDGLGLAVYFQEAAA